MKTRPAVFTLSCLMAISVVLAVSGCGPDEKKEAAVGQPPTPESVQPEPKKNNTGLETEKSGLEPSASQVESPPIDAERTNTETKMTDKGSEGTALAAEFNLVSDLWETHTKSAPLFTHEKHTKVHGIACSECHHVYEQEKNVWKQGMPVKKCGACHDEPTIKSEKKLPPDVQKKNLKLAFHNNCRGCHKTLKKENPESPVPVTCSQCHPKE